MADNISLAAASGGSTLGTDEIGGIHYQLIKLGFGVLDSLTLVSNAAGLPVAQQGAWAVSISGTVAATQSGTWNVGATTRTTGGATPYKLVSAATTNAQSVKAAAGTLYGIQGYNKNTGTPAYLKIYDKASAPIVGTDIPVKVILLPASTGGGGSNVPLGPQGVALVNGIAIAITAGIVDADTTAVGASDVVINLDYA